MKLTTTSDVKAWAVKRYASQHKKWLAGELDSFPLKITLCELTERDFMTQPDKVRGFYGEWTAWPGAGELTSNTWKWPRAGEHTLPAALTLRTPEEVATLAGALPDWERVSHRMNALQAISAKPAAAFANLYDLLNGLQPRDWACFKACIRYFVTHPQCDLYIRQLPIEGVDTKWVGKHLPELTKTLSIIVEDDGDFYALTGVRRPDHLNHVMVRILCPELRKQVAGLDHLDVPVSAVAKWSMRPNKVFFVENLESGLALGDLDGTIAFIGKGNAATSLAAIDWVAQTPCYYWGDLDTHGLAIFARMKARLPQLMPLLMDAPTLARYKALWVTEPVQHGPVEGLPFEQHVVWNMLTKGVSTKGIRLEQERIPWNDAWSEVCRVLANP